MQKEKQEISVQLHIPCERDSSETDDFKQLSISVIFWRFKFLTAVSKCLNFSAVLKDPFETVTLRFRLYFCYEM
jgi:hypothetical protein